MTQMAFRLISVPGTFSLSRDEATGEQLYRKELAYPGTFAKEDPHTRETEFELPVDERLIDHWVKTFDQMQKNGVEVPVPLGHTEDAEKRRGTVARMAKEKNEKGLPALFCYVRFSKPEYAEQFKDSNVSLYMPPAWTDGKKNHYVMPIQHVAITDYPVIPGLGKFQAVAAGFELSLAKERVQMDPIAELAKEMGIEVPEGGDAKAAILEAWDATGEGGEEHVEPEMPEGGEGEDEFPVDDEIPPDEEFNDDPPPALSMGFDTMPTVHPAMVRQVATSRVNQLDQLVKDRKITPAQARDFKETYCGQSTVGYALSLEAADPTMNDGFEKLIATLAKGVALAHNGEQTGAQAHNFDPAKSPIVKIAEKRRAQQTTEYR